MELGHLQDLMMAGVGTTGLFGLEHRRGARLPSTCGPRSAAI
jgi:hypothetical protein